MRSPDGRFVLAYNGEIYNHAALRAELEARGERFVGRSDTEVVLRLLVRQGEAALARFEGMFALALLDTETDEVLLARDRMGQKPMYVATLTGGGFAFASELRPLLELPNVDAAIDKEALSHLLSFGFVPAPFSLRRGIRQLEPGTLLRLGPSGAGGSARFCPAPGPRAPRRSGSLEDLSRELEEVVSEAVRTHLVSDVPVGVLLSSGVDSGVVTALAARHVSKLQTFTVVHRDPAYDERRAARDVARSVGADHHEIEIPEAGLSPEALDLLADHHGDPFADSSSLNVLALCREMRRHVTVALSGDGGDEVFAGYPRFAQLRWLGRLAFAPAPALLAASRLLSRAGSEWARQAARALHVAALPATRRAVAYTSFFWPEDQARLLQSDWQPESPSRCLDGLLEARGATLEPDPVASAHWLEQRLILPDCMLTKVDRMSMVSALEVRPALLGARVLDFAESLPFGAKNRGREGKRVLRQLARRLLPPGAADLPKRGFGLPLTGYGGPVLEEASRFALESEASPLRPIFRPHALAELAAQLRPGAPRGGPEDSTFRREHQRWLLAVLAWTLARQGGLR